ncbi:hypothetical protein KSD_14230 [Ktedonobacter sp. SOSP1-85]|nr:hypothetical protein KSD_14230 [Ktedonobacter sp. SOSP1-85]
MHKNSIFVYANLKNSCELAFGVGEGKGGIKKGKACLVWGYKQALDPGRNDLSKPVTHSGKT